jgi:hypothetical protein
MAELESDDAYMIVDDGDEEEESDDFYGGSSDDEENVKPKKQTVVATSKGTSKKTSTNTKTTKKSAFAVIAPSNKKVDSVLGSKENLKSLTTSTSHVTQKEKTVEEKYQKKSQIEHILLRPDTYSTCCMIHLRFANVLIKTLTRTTSYLLAYPLTFTVLQSWFDTTINDQYVYFE